MRANDAVEKMYSQLRRAVNRMGYQRSNGYWIRRYLRMLLTHGALAILRAAELARRAGKQLDDLRTRRSRGNDW